MDKITITWHIDDLLDLNENLTIEQRREVLQRAKEGHDCNEGINWEVLQVYIDEIKEEEV